MKKYLIFVLICVVFLGTCENSLFNPIFDNDKNFGNVQIYIGNDNTRTILPIQYDLSSIHYKFSFTGNGAPIIENLSEGTFVNLEIPVGTYNLAVYGFENEAAANADARNVGAGALYIYRESNIVVSYEGAVIINILLEPNPSLFRQTEGGTGTLRYEITIPEGASGTFTVKGIPPISLTAIDNVGEIILESDNYEVVVLVNYNGNIKVIREIAQIFDGTTSLARYVFTEEDIINSADMAITDIDIEQKIGAIQTSGSNITVWVHPDMEDYLSSITPNITFTGDMIQPIGPQDFSGETPVEYTVFSQSGLSITYNVTVRKAAYFTSPPNFSVLELANATTEPNQLRYQFVASSPTATGNYKIYYMEGDIDDANLIYAEGTAAAIGPTGNYGTSATAGTSSTTSNAAHANNRVFFVPKYGTTYSVVVVATNTGYVPAVSNVLKQTINAATWTTLPNFSELMFPNATTEPNQLRYQFVAASPNATYRIFYLEGDINDASRIYNEGTAALIGPTGNYGTNATAGTSTTTSNAAHANNRVFFVPKYSTQYSVVVAAERDGYEPGLSNIRQITTGAATWATLPNFQTLELANATTEPNQLRYQFVAASPNATYRIFYLEGDINDASRIYNEGTAALIGPTGNFGTNATAGTSTTTSNAAHANNRVFFAPKYGTQYSVVVAAERDGYEPGLSNIRQITTGAATWVTLPNLQSVILPDPVNMPNLLRYQFTASSPATNVTYTVYYLAEDTNDESRIIANGTAISNAIAGTGNVTDRNFTVPLYSTTYSIVVVAYRDQYPAGISNIVKQKTRSMVKTIVNVREEGLNTIINWSFADQNDDPYYPESDITLTYKYSGLVITGGKLTNSVINETSDTKILPSNTREYIIASDNLISIKDIVISTEDTGESIPVSTKTIELRLYNIAYDKAKEYGAIELFSHGKSYSSAGTLGPTVQARGNTIVNYKNGKPDEIYLSTFSLGHGGLSGAAQATQNRESYYDGITLYSRSNGGNTNMSSGGTGATAPTRPAAASWDTVNSVTSGHVGAWNNFVDAFEKNPFNYISNDINNAYLGLYEYQYLNPQSTSNNWTSGRTSSPFGLIETTTRGALAYSNGSFEFTISLDANKTDSKIIIEWAGDQDVQSLGNSYITFVIDEDMRFVKYLAMDSYTVQLLSATTYTCATYYFVYHQDSIDIGSYATFRPHQLRPNHVNYVPAGANKQAVIAPHGNTATGDMVVANSRYAINLDWINRCTTKVNIP